MNHYTFANWKRSSGYVADPGFHTFAISPRNLPDTFPLWVLTALFAIPIHKAGPSLTLSAILGYVAAIILLVVLFPATTSSEGPDHADIHTDV